MPLGLGIVPYDGLMSTPILATKLFVPPSRFNVVLRPRLIERLDQGLRGRLILVSAPAGFGKTTMISEWVAGCRSLEPEVRAAWLSLDEGDSDPARFLAYLVAALRTVAAGVGDGVLGMLQSPQPPPIESMLTALLNEITSLPHDVVLVLDDYHVVDSGAVDEALAFLLEHLPPGLHLVIATREDPHLPLARWRAGGRMTELRAADLRFTPSEAAEFLNRVMGLDLSAEDISALETRTEGWIAGLQMAALSIQGRPDAAGFIQAFTGSHRFVLDYLVEEVLQRQPERARSFLLQTAILDKLCGALCDAVTAQKQGIGMLERLERGNLFVVPLDDKREWYRYHRLFADVLRARLLAEQPDQLPALHRRASEWYEANGWRSDAIHHALCVNDFGRAAGLIEVAGPLVEEGSSQTATWLRWVRALPEEFIRARPVLSVWYAYALLGRGEIEAAEAWLTDAEQWLQTPDQADGPSASREVVVDEEQLRSLLATIGVARAYRAHSLGDVSGTVNHAQRVLELLPEGDHLRREQATALMGMTYWASGDLEAADRVFTGYAERLLAAGNMPDAISATTVLADVRPALGRLREAEDTLGRLLQFVVNRGEPLPPDTADLYRGLAEFALARGDLAAAAEHLLRSKELGEQADLPVWRYRWHVAQARLKEMEGDLEGALSLLDEAQRLFIRTPLPESRPISALRAQIWAKQGRVTEAVEWARDRGLSVDDDLSYLREFEHITLARVLIARYESRRVAGAVHDAARLLERLLRAAEEGGRKGSASEILKLQALARQFTGPSGAPAATGELLSERELEVLRHIAEGLANREIATRLYLSLYTVKAHARSIYDKLDAHSRTQAVAKARELGMLPPH
jgi:LuxR family maltose regulon positive regulatory protein